MSIPYTTDSNAKLLDDYKKFKEHCEKNAWKDVYAPYGPYDDEYTYPPSDKYKPKGVKKPTMPPPKRRKPKLPTIEMLTFYVMKKGAVIVVEQEDGTVSTMVVDNEHTQLAHTAREWQQPTMWCFFYPEMTPPCRYIINPGDIEKEIQHPATTTIISDALEEQQRDYEAELDDADDAWSKKYSGFYKTDWLV